MFVQKYLIVLEDDARICRPFDGRGVWAIGFLKAERVEIVRASGFLEPLNLLLKQAGKGGGGKKVRERIFTEYREKFPTPKEVYY